MEARRQKSGFQISDQQVVENSLSDSDKELLNLIAEIIVEIILSEEEE